MNTLGQIAQIASAVTSISAALVLVIKPIRERIFGIAKTKDGIKCLLRASMLNIYYKHLDSNEIRQYEYENFSYMYAAYKALGGNSFIDKIKKEIDEWAIKP